MPKRGNDDSGRMKKTDILIGGGGLAGLALAIALRQGLGERFRRHRRRSRRSDGRRAMRARPPSRPRRGACSRPWMCGSSVEADAQPILDMVVTDSKLDDALRPTFLHVRRRDRAGRAVRAHDRESAADRGADASARRRSGVELLPLARRAFRKRVRSGICRHLVEWRNDSRQSFSSPPMARARRSASRPASRASAGNTDNPALSRPSRMSAITTAAPRSISCRRVRSRSCRSRASAHPSSGRKTKRKPNASWRCRTRNSTPRSKSVSDLHLGDIAIAGPRRAYPLGLSVARSFIAERIALVGDAAHVIHPIAGQGLNMGLRDIAALAESVVDAVRLGLDPGSAAVLERYQRWRRFDTMAMGVATDGLNRLFSNRSDVLRLARDVGLGTRRPAAGAEGVFHPRSRRRHRRGAEAPARRGAVEHVRSGNSFGRSAQH